MGEGEKRRLSDWETGRKEKQKREKGRLGEREN
jgi:hypothetical protein